MNFLKMKDALAFIGILAVAVSLWFLKGYCDRKIIDSKNETIRSLQDTIQSKENIIAKNDTIIALYQEQVAGLTKKDDGNKENEKVYEKIYPDDNGFDAQDLGSGFFAFQVFGPIKNPNKNKFPDKIPNHTPWKFGDGNSGIAANGSGLYLTGATNGDSNGATSKNGQAGFLEYKGSSISQSITLPAGTYTVTFDYEGRRDYAPANQVAVSIDGTVLFKGAPTDCANFKQVTTSSITLTTSGEHELMFRGLGSINDISAYPCTFIDNICINRISPKTPSPDVEMDDADATSHSCPPVVFINDSMNVSRSGGKQTK